MDWKAVAGLIIALIGVVLTWVTAQPQLCEWRLPFPICVSAREEKEPPPPPPPGEFIPYDLGRLSAPVRDAAVAARFAADEAQRNAERAAPIAAQARAIPFRVDAGLAVATHTAEDGHTYSGEWSGARPHGLGVENRIPPAEPRPGVAYGVSYEGQWEYGVPGASGVFEMSDGTTVSAQMNGQQVGFGRVRRPSGLIYEGELVEGKPSGHGVEWRPNGDINLAGVWSDGRMVQVEQAPR